LAKLAGSTSKVRYRQSRSWKSKAFSTIYWVGLPPTGLASKARSGCAAELGTIRGLSFVEIKDQDLGHGTKSFHTHDNSNCALPFPLWKRAVFTKQTRSSELQSVSGRIVTQRRDKCNRSPPDGQEIIKSLWNAKRGGRGFC
jgi:hypothetical protein